MPRQRAGEPRDPEGHGIVARTRPNADKEVISIHGSCHPRGGRSKTSGRPYPHAYVAGDDLFEDFRGPRARQQAQVDSSDAHVYLKTRAVMEGGSTRAASIVIASMASPEPRKGGGKYFSECVTTEGSRAEARLFTRPSPTSRDCAAGRCCDPSQARRDRRAAAAECSAAADRARARTSALR